MKKYMIGMIGGKGKISHCLVHFTSLIFSQTMEKERIDPKELFHFPSSVYQTRLRITGRIARQLPELYPDIQFENSALEKTLKSYEDSFDTLKGAVLSKGSQNFEAVFKNVQDFLGEDVLEGGQKTTDAFIQLMRTKC